MDFSTMIQSLQSTLGESLPRIIGALAILVVGWFVAIIIRAVVRKGLGMLGLNQRMESTTGRKMDVEGGAAVGVYYIVLLMVLVAFFNTLRLHLVSQPIQSLVDTVIGYVPKLAAGGLLILVAFVLATILRQVATRALSATRLDEKLSAQAGMKPISESLGNVLYWLVFLLFLPGILGALEIEGLLRPTQEMIDQILGMVPNIFAATVIGLVGWFIARLLRDLVANLTSVAGADRLGERAGLRGTMSLSRLLGLVVYVFVLVPALIQALDTLKIAAISAPATEMLRTFWQAIPNVFAAAVILLVAYLVAGFVADLVANLLAGVGFNAIPGKIGLGRLFGGELTASMLVGRIVLLFAMVFAVVEAANRLNFTQVADLVATFIEFGGQVLLGGVIIAIGMWVSGLAHAAVRSFQSPNAPLAAAVARWGILGLVFAMGLRAMGIADDIVNLAFGLTLGSVAVAVALSFGLGGREAAGRQMEHWLSRMRGQ